ncbi:MAG: molybdenum cofactor biosynthesis protein MoaE [Planctomycetes bacterium]|nr:molybdenum cofactor biosynthesis protein MoaE [Planctomycetota bacterium]
MSHIVKDPIDVEGVVADVAKPEAGAVLTFAGTVRDSHRGRKVIGIEYYAYEAMAVKEMDRLEEQIRERWPESSTRIVHRIGDLQVGDASVVIAVSSPHRAEGFESLRYAIDTLKETAPIWKKEKYAGGDYEWIEGS